MKNHLSTAFFGLSDMPGFIQGIQQSINGISGQSGIYAGDNLFTYHRNLGFLEDEPLMRAFEAHASTDIEKAVLWRISTVLWGVRNGLRLEGDFVECACYKGTTARIVCDAVDFANRPDRHYYLYDLFDHDPSLPHHAMPEHSKQLYAQVKDRMVPGAVLILDDYGWLAYRAQKLAEDPWFAKYGYRVLEMPTGQGLLIK